MPTWERRLLIFAPPAVVVAFVAVLFLSMQQSRATTDRVQLTYQTIGIVDRLRTRLVDTETGQRGFLITGDSSYLEPQKDADAEVRALLERLRPALAGDSMQAQALDRLAQHTRTRLDILALPIQQRAISFEAARDQLIAGRGREAMAELRAELNDIESREWQSLERLLDAQTSAGWRVLVVLFAGALGVIFVAALTHRRFQHYERQLEAANREQGELNTRLQEQAVELELQAQELELRTVELEESGAELLTANDELKGQHGQLEELAVELETANDDLQTANRLAEDRRAEAEAANQAKTQFLTSMSHELRTPLNAIGGYVDLLDMGVQGPLTDAQRASLQRIRHNGRHLLVLINDILDFAKVQAGKVELRTEDVALDTVIAETGELVKPLLQAKSIALRAGAESTDVVVRGDADRIRQILLNLLTNAAKYTDTGGVVEISVDADPDPDRVRVRVRDNGWGIPPEMHDRIFDPFIQLKRGAGGTLADGVGLGLSISRELARAMDGELRVESAPGEGSTFTLVLARARSLTA